MMGGWLSGRLAKPLTGFGPSLGSNPSPPVRRLDHPSGWGGDAELLARACISGAYRQGPAWTMDEWRGAAERLAANRLGTRRHLDALTAASGEPPNGLSELASDTE